MKNTETYFKGEKLDIRQEHKSIFNIPTDAAILGDDLETGDEAGGP